MAAPRLVVFDAIETLFSLEPVRSRLNEAGAPVHTLDVWFARLLRGAFALTAAAGYAPFRSLAEGLCGPSWPTTGSRQPTSSSMMRSSPRSARCRSTLTGRQRSKPSSTPGSPSTSSPTGPGRQPISWSRTQTPPTSSTRSSRFTMSSMETGAGAVPACRGCRRRRPRRGCACVAVHGWDICGARSAGLRTGWCSRLEHHLSPALGPADATGTSLLEVVHVLLDS